jgi:competence protein ComEA
LRRDDQSMPSLPISRQHALLVAAVLVLALVLADRFLLHAGTAEPRAAPPPVASVAPAQIVVDVVGAVRRPGLYRLRQSARVADAIARAGGLSRRADRTLVNLAAPIADGQQVLVPARVPASPAAGGGSSTTQSGPVHLNTATLEEFDALPGVGPVTAQKILDYRQKHGAFTSVDELDAIAGIGPARLDSLRDLVTP